MQSDPATIDYSKMPKRVFIFGVTALPTQVIQLFAALGKIIPVFFMNLNPCQEYWGDMRSEKVNWKWEKEQIVKYLRSNALKDKYELDIKGVHGFDLSSAKEDAIKQIKAMRASKIEAYRELSEQVNGIYIRATDTLNSSNIETSNSVKSEVDGFVHGARVIRQYAVGDTYATELELDTRVIYDLYQMRGAM